MTHELKDEHSAYAPSSATDVAATFRRHGWIPPSEDPAMQEKWSYYKRLPQLCEEALHDNAH